MTYTEAQYSTPSAHERIMNWLNGDTSTESIEIVAKYMSCTLRIAGIRSCRALVKRAIEATGSTE